MTTGCSWLSDAYGTPALVNLRNHTSVPVGQLSHWPVSMFSPSTHAAIGAAQANTRLSRSADSRPTPTEGALQLPPA